jgi:hypothetical protein
MSFPGRSSLLMSRCLGAAAVAALVAAPSASAAMRYAAPAGSGSACTADAPCAVADAVAKAASGDDVVLASGTYPVTATIKATVALTVEGTPGQPRPRLLGDPSLAGDTLALAAGGTARRLDIAGTGKTGAALDMRGGTGEDLILYSSSQNGAAAMLKATRGGTLLRDALAVCRACGDGAVSFTDGQDDDAGAVAAGVTAVASGSSTAIDSSVSHGTVALVDVIAGGGGDDIDGLKDSPVRVSHSSFRAAASRAISDGGGNVGPAVFVDAAGGDFHQAAGSPTIDAGIVDARTGGVALDGSPRIDGAAPDIGAYEGVGPASGGLHTGVTAIGLPAGAPGTGTDPLGGDLAPAGKPAIHRTVAVGTAAGTVLVRLPGSARAVPLDDAAKLPLGSEIDATAGTVRLTSAVSAATSQTGLFSGGRFRVRQTAGPRPVTQIVLSGGDFSRCPRAGGAHASRKGPLRRLWGRDHGGRFVTIGRSAAATVRGTRWLTEDTCAGTRVSVDAGAVVVRPTHKGRAVTVRAHHSHLVRAT